jgi:hypothetical protein
MGVAALTPLRAGLVLLLGALPATVGAQVGYRLRLDTRVQTLSFRGLTADSILVGDTVTGPGGGPATADGYAVTCLPGVQFCHFYRSGPVLHGAPIVASADLTLWGLGITGLSARVSARAAGDMSSARLWPGTAPRFQLLEGYLEYARTRFTARVGRQLTTSRLGYEGFDGGRLLVRDARHGLEADGYLGWGLTNGVALPVTSPAVNPLGDFQPVRRQIVAGAGAGWSGTWGDLRADYLREVDPDVHYFVSERFGVQAVVRGPVEGLTLQAGSDWDLAAGLWGSAEAALTYVHNRVSATAGARRYRPHFALWTIWGAFSPVPYHAAYGQVGVRATRWLDVRARGERYGYEASDASTALVDVEDRGWRWELGGTGRLPHGLTADAGYQAEFGPGASVAGWTGSVTYAPPAQPRLLVTLQGATLQRPLEFRFDESRLKSLGFNVQADVTPSLRLGLGGIYYTESRRRPDALGLDWNQFRMTASAVLMLGRGADLQSLPPAVRRIPTGDGTR